MNLINKIVKIFFNIILSLTVLIFIIVVYNFFQIEILKKDYTAFFGYTSFEVVSGSMSETIEIDDLVIVKITDDLQENDIISFKDNDEIITHRLIKIDENTLYTKGDANNSEDKTIDKSQVIGKVIKVLPRFGIWVKVFSDTKVIISIIITLLLFGFAIEKEENKDITDSKEKKSLSRFMRNRREKKNGKSEEKGES